MINNRDEKDIKKTGYQQQVEEQAKKTLAPDKDLNEQATEQAVNPFYSFSPDVPENQQAYSRPTADIGKAKERQDQRDYQIKHAESPEMQGAAMGAVKEKIDLDANKQNRNKNVQRSYLADFIKEQGQSIIESEAGKKALAGVSDKKEYASRLRRLIGDAYRASDHYSEANKQIDYLNIPYEEKERLHKEKIQGNIRSQLEEMTNEVSSLYTDAVERESQDDLSKITEGSLIQRAMKANMYAQKDVIGAHTTQEARQLSIANKYLHEASILIRENDKKDGSKLASAGRAFADTAFNLDNWTFGVSESMDNAEIKEISERFEKGGKLTEAEEKLMDSLAINLATNLYFDEANRGYQWGSIAGESLPFMVELMLNPVAGAGKGITKAIGKYGLKKFGSKAAQRAMRAVGAVAGDLASASALTATSGVFNTANEIERRISGDHTFKFNEQTGNVEYAGIEGEGEGLFTAISKGIGSQLIEYFSEMGGERFGEVAGLVGLSAPGKWLNNKYSASMVGKAFGKMQGSNVYKTMRELEKRAQWSGTLGEYLEEAYGTVLNSIFVGDESISDLADVEQQVDTFMGLLLSGGAMSGMRTVGYATDRINTAVKLKSLNSKMPDYIDNWDQVKSAIDNMTIGERSQLITDLSKSDKNDLSLGARKNLADYVARLTYKEAMTSTEEEIRAQNKAKAEEQGVNLYHKAVQDRRATALVKAKMEADALLIQKDQIEEKLRNKDTRAIWHEDNGLEMGLITQEEYNTYKAYDNAKARWNSFQDQLYKEVEDFVQPQVEQMSKYGVHEDGKQVVQVNLGTEFEPDFQFVKRGNIVTAEDGGIDFSRSDEIIYTTKEGGGLEQVSTRDILSHSPNKTTLKDFEQELRERAQSEIVDPLIDKLEQKAKFKNGEQVEFRDEKGNAHTGTVTNASENIVIVTDEAGESKAMTNDDLANSLISEQVAGLQARDQVEVYIDGEAHMATVDHVIDGTITLDIPTAPDVANRFMDVTAEEMEALLNPNNKEQTVIDEFEQAKANNTEAGTAENLQNDIDVPSGDKEVSANDIETSETESKQFPRNAEGDIDYKAIETDEMFLDALREDFKDTPNEIADIIDDYTKLAQKKVTNAKKKQDPIARRKAVAQAEAEVKRWQKMKHDYMVDANSQFVAEQEEKAGQTPSLNEQREEKREQETLVNAGQAGANISDKWNSSTKHTGSDDTIMLANNEAIEGTYMLIEADAPTASHNPEAGFSKSEGFPTRQDGKTVNDRDYENDKDAQSQVQLRAQNYNQKAIQDVPVVSAEGVVYSGNDRTMASQIAARLGTDKAYTDYLAKNAQRYGFTQEQFDSMEHPRLVFVPKNAMPYTTETFSKFNRDEKKSQSNLEQAVKASKTASVETISKLADTVSRFDKLSNLYASEKATTDIINTLLDTGVIMQNEVARLKNGNLLSQEGKSFLENIMLGSVLNEDSLRKTNSMPSVRQSLMRIMPQLLNNAKLRDYNLQSELNNAISLLYDAHKTGNDVNLQLMQTNLFEASPAEIYNEVEKLLANALQKEKDTDLRAIFEAYNSEALKAETGQADMFEGILTKPELLTKILNHYGQRQESGTEQTSDTTASNSQSSGQKQPTGQRPTDGSRRSIDELNNAFDNSSSPQEKAEIARELNQEYNRLFGSEDVVDVYETVEDFAEAFSQRVREVYPQNAERHISELKEDLAKGYKFSGVEVGGRILVNTSHIATANDLNRTWLHEQTHIADSKAFTPEQKENANIPEINNFIPEVYHSDNNRVKFSEAIAFAVEGLLDNHTMEQIATGEADLSGINNEIRPYVEQTLNKLTNGRRKTDTDRRHDETAHNATKSSSKRVRQKEKTGDGHSTTAKTTEADRGGTQQQQQPKSKEQQELEDLLKGLADDLGIEDVRFRKDSEITPPSTAAIEKVLKINSLLVKQGKVGFEDYARVFINAMGDSIKPYLQGFYFLAKGANPSVQGFNSLSEVESISLDNINRPESVNDQIADAGNMVDTKPTEKQKETSKPTKYSSTNNSVDGNSQQAVIEGDKITVNNKRGREKLGSFDISLSEWEETFRGPSFNPSYNQRELVEKKHIEAFPGNLEDGYLTPVADRVVGAEVSAIRDAYNKYKSAQEENKESPQTNKQGSLFDSKEQQPTKTGTNEQQDSNTSTGRTETKSGGLSESKPLSFNQWRHTWTSTSNVSVFPYLVGEKFTDAQVKEIEEWARNNGFIINEAKDTVIRLLLPSKGMDRIEAEERLTANNMQKVFDQQIQDERDKQNERRREKEERAKQRDSHQWIIDNFGQDIMNGHNMNALSDILEGVTDKFDGQVNYKWLDGIKKLNAFTADGKGVDFKKLKELYDNHVNTKDSAFELFENEGEWKVVTSTQHERPIGNIVFQLLDGKQYKDYKKLRDEIDNASFATQEEAKEKLSQLQGFERKHASIFEKAKEIAKKWEEDNQKKETDNIPTSPDGKYQIYKIDVNGKEWYGIPSAQNKGERDKYDDITESLEEAIEIAEQNRQEEIDNAKRAADAKEQIERQKAEEDARKKENEGKSPAQIMKEARENKVLDEDKSYNGVVKTRREFITDAVNSGSTFEVAKVPAIKDPSNARWNNMTAREQEQFEAKKKAAGEKNEYRVYDNDGSFYTITKIEYDYANKLLSEANSENKPTKDEYESFDTRGYTYVVVKDGAIVSRGSNPIMAKEPMPIKRWLDYAEKADGDLYIAPTSGQPIKLDDDQNRIFGYTFEQISDMQQRRPIANQHKIDMPENAVLYPRYEELYPQTNDQGSLLNNKEQDNLKDKENVPNRPTDSESGSKQQPDKIQPDVSSVQPDGRRNGETRGGNEAVTGESGRSTNGSTGSGLFPNLSGEPSNNGSNKQDRTTQPSQRDARDIESGRTKDGDVGGLSDSIDQSDRKSTKPDSSHGKKPESFEERTKRRIEQQKAAESIPVKLMDEANIRETLPLLLPEQQDDVVKAEKRFFSDEQNTPEKAIGKGFLFTNGTGTGKTFTGLGIAKRFDKQGKKNILIVVPSQAKVADWSREGEMIGLKVTPLLDTVDGGEGAVVTTYANFRANEALRERDLDLLIFDESHRILEEKSGKESTTFHQFQQHANVSPQIAFRRLQSVHPVWKEIQDLTDQIYNIESLMSDLDMMDWKYANNSKTRDDLQKQRDALQERWNNEIEPDLQKRAEKAYRNSKVVLLSATPFKGHFNLKYANKVLFDWGDQETVNSRGSRVNPEAQFYLNNFGSAYEWKYHRLQSKSDANAEAIAMQEVEFAEKLKRDGVMSGRAIESDMDYSREFPLVTLEKSDMFNAAYEYLTTQVPEELRDVVKAVLQDYNYSTRLFESLRASMAIPRIQAHLDMNRKVVVFHRRRVSNVTPPFATILQAAEQAITGLEGDIRVTEAQGGDISKQLKTLKEIRESVAHFKKNFGELLAWEQTLDYSSALDQIEAAFPGKVLAINGSTKKSDKEKAPAIFNDSNSGKDVIVIQEEAGKEGISLHDKGGDRPRALISLSLPQATTTTLQIEGRIFRIGQESNAIFEYPLLGLDLELERFGNDINKRLSTTENLSMGEASRDLLRSFAEGVLFQSSADAPHDGQGIGGKEFDKKAQSDTTPFQKAVLTYHTKQKERGGRDQREGVDFFATPEPIGFKMVEWAQLKPQETALEPSAGNGAIAMHFPKNVSTTVIEPSPSLYSRLMLRAGSSGDVQGRNIKFEDHHIVNKYDAIAMNPPFGVGGKTAMEHLEKGLNHLKEGGRLIAIIPRGRMDKRLDDFLNETNKAGRKVNGHFHLRGEMTLPSVTFEQAGTSVSTRIVVIDRLEVPTVEKISNKILETNRHKNIMSGGGIARMSAEEISSAAERIHGDMMKKINAQLSYSIGETKSIDDVFNSIEHTPMAPRLEAIDNSKAINEASGDVSKWMDSQTGKNESYIKTFEQKHSQTGNVMYMAKPETQLSREDYTRIKDIARMHNGFWSRYSNEAEGIQSGFVFKEAEDAQKFAKSASEYLSEKEDSPRFRKLVENISTPLEDITNRVDIEAETKSKEFGNGRINTEAINPKNFFSTINEAPNYREDGTTYVENPIINVYNLAPSLYQISKLLNPVRDLRNNNYFRRKGDTGYLDMESVRKFADAFPEAISEYEDALKKTMLLSTDAAQREILDILSDIDYAKDYYNRLAESEDVFRMEDEPRFRKETPITYDDASYNTLSKEQQEFVDNVTRNKYVGARVVNDLMTKDGVDFTYSDGGLVLDSSVNSKERMDEILVSIALQESAKVNPKLHEQIKEAIDKDGLKKFTWKLKAESKLRAVVDKINDFLRKLFNLPKDYSIINATNLHDLRRLFSPNIRYALNENNKHRNPLGWSKDQADRATVKVKEYAQNGIEAYHSLNAFTQGRYTEADIMQYHADMMNANESEEISGFLSNNYNTPGVRKKQIRAAGSGEALGQRVMYSLNHETPIIELYRWDASSNMNKEGDNSLKYPTATDRTIRKTDKASGRVQAKETADYIKTLHEGYGAYPEAFFPFRKGSIRSVIIRNVEGEKAFDNYRRILELTDNLSPDLVAEHRTSVFEYIYKSGYAEGYDFMNIPSVETITDLATKMGESLRDESNFKELESQELKNLYDANGGFDIQYGYMSAGDFHDVSKPHNNEQPRYRKAESLMDNLDNAEKVIENYNNVLSDVFNNSQKKAEILNKAKANGMNLKHAIESYIAEDATLDEVEAIAKEIGADIPDNALRYVFWRNANPNDGTMVWKAKNAIAEREYKEDVLFRKTGPVRSDALEEYERKVRGARGFKKAGSLDGILFGIEEGWFDRMASLRILQDVIVGKGNEIPTGRNAYLLENQMSSKNVAQIEHYQQKYLDPMIKEAGELFDHNATEIDYYLIAKHGLERNRVMAEQEVERQSAKERADAEQLLAEGFLSQEDYDKAIAKLDEKDKKKLEKLLESKDYSGLTALYNLLEDNPLEYSSGVKDRIQRYVEEVESTKDTAKLWELINASTKYMLKRQFDSGYMSRENYEKIRDMYEHYVPLRGFDETTATDIYDYIENKPSNFNKLLKKAHGRKSLSVSPFISLMSMAQSGVMEVNRNDMKKAFYRLVATNPSALATIKDVWYVESEDGEWNERHPDIPENATGEEVARIVEGFEAEMQELKAKDKAKRGRNNLDVGVKIHKAQASEHAVKLWVNGEEKVIYINGSPRAAQAINGLTNSASKERGDLMRTAQFWMRQMSANFTSRNPEFLVTNMQRDVNFAVTSAAIKEGPAYAAKLSANLAKVGKTIAKEIYGKGGGKYGELWEEFTWNGGETGYAILHSEDTNRKYMNNKLREFSNRKDIIKPVRIWINQIENANRLIEANTRFATYVTSREMGRSIEQSIANAKDITVNFNRKGAGTYWADVIHGLYLFSNPALQSMRQMGLMAKKNPVRFGAAAAITTLGGFMMPLLNQLLINMFGDDGDDELYRNLSDWTKQNHMVMYIPGTKDKFMSFALSHELRGFHGIGVLGYEAMNGNLRGKNIPLEVTKQFANNLPLDPTGGRSSLVPDVLKPIVEAYYTNTNFMDRPIYKKNPWNENAPEWTKAYKKTYPELVEFTKFLNELTGGDDVVAGAVNLNPARMEHVFKGYVGGAWTTYSDAISQLYGLITGDEESQNLFNIPITRKIVKTSDEFNKELRINSEYFYWLDWMKEYERVQRGYLKIATTPDREADRDKYINKYMGTFGETPTHMYNRLKRMSEAIKKVEDSGSEKDAMKMKADLIDYMWELEAKAKQED